MSKLFLRSRLHLFVHQVAVEEPQTEDDTLELELQVLTLHLLLQRLLVSLEAYYYINVTARMSSNPKITCKLAKINITRRNPGD
jgi:hypothetical protein